MTKAVAIMLSALTALCCVLAGVDAQSAPIATVIDAEFEKAWQRDGLTPANAANDAEFLRRVYLDVVGVPPTREEAIKFLDGDLPGKRAELIDALIADPRFGKHLSDLWTAILAGRAMERGGGPAGDLMAVWLAQRFNENKRFDETVTQLVTATGKASVNPAVTYITMIGQPPRTADVAGLVMKHFAGVQIQCAQCHDHPYDSAWKQADFAGVASFFAPVELKIDFTRQPYDPDLVEREMPSRRDIENFKRTTKDAEGRTRAEELLAYYTPKLPGDVAVKTRDVKSWRPMFARWLVAPENPATARYLVNRFWSFLFGSGLALPVDDFNSLTKTTHPELLNALAREFAGDFDVKRLYRRILNSRVYQLSGERSEKTASAGVRQLAPEQFFGALFTLTEGDALERSFGRLAVSPFVRLRQVVDIADKQRKPDSKEPYPYDRDALARYEKILEGMDSAWRLRRALSAAYSRLSSDDEMADSDGFTLTIDQALAVLNGEVTRRLGGTLGGTLLRGIIDKHATMKDRVEALYLSVLSRRPTDAEAKRGADFVAGEVVARRKEPDAWEDLFFALISTTEFATNH
ncbi:MAG: DUF1553 domain-containing protein [Planctomycetes bacterium]|nr:DUF1553 domain-containing protein [Planctomycetota bacterium]